VAGITSASPLGVACSAAPEVAGRSSVSPVWLQAASMIRTISKNGIGYDFIGGFPFSMLSLDKLTSIYVMIFIFL
jgi:hypothetical protein